MNRDELNLDEAWLKNLNDDELSYFITWATECSLYRVYKADGDWVVHEPDHILRGFVMGLRCAKELNEKS